MSAKTRTRDDSSLHKCRIELSILIDDLNLSVYAFRLYVHLKRIVDRSAEHSCWESARTLASKCNMSSGQVSKAKDELVAKGLIVRHIKMMRGGIGDDITIVDIWPQTFAHYAPESEPPKGSDHHTITSTVEVITTRSLSESDHHTITSGESDHQVIAETIKRSYSDPIDHDQYHIESDSNTPTPTPETRETSNGVGDDDVYESETRALFASYGIMAARKLATQYAAMSERVDLATIRSSIDALLNPSEDRNLNKIARRLQDAPPAPGIPYVRQRTVGGAGAPPPAPVKGVSPERLAALKYDYRKNSHDTS